ncbi:MAG: MFS transporter [Pseudolabrys sp.]
MATHAATPSSIGWRTPLVIMTCGCIIGALSFGPRASLGLFLTPMSETLGWSRNVFSLALAIQAIVWGIGQPIAGMLADRFGSLRVLFGGSLLYFAGLVLMTYASTPGVLDLTAGVIAGFGIAGTSFNLVIAAFGKLLPPTWRMQAFGAGTAASSFGQFLFSPLAVALMRYVDWQHALIIIASTTLIIAPLSLAVRTKQNVSSAGPDVPREQDLRHALGEAFGHRSYVLLALGFFTCGFQLFFITIHLPSFLVDRGLTIVDGAWTIGFIGLFNIFGSFASGWLGARMPKRYLLAIIYLLRSAAIAAFILLPITSLSAMIFGGTMGILWLSTVPPTSGLVALMFGTRWMSTLFGFVFLAHQVGGFLGAWLGGLMFERTGSYDLVWWLSIGFGVLSALINLPIVEKPVPRLAAAAA